MNKTLLATALIAASAAAFAAEPILKLDGETLPAGATGVTVVDGGVVGKAYKLDGTGGFDVAKNLDLKDAFSYAIWINPEKLPGNYMQLIDYPMNLLRTQSKNISMNLNGWHTIKSESILKTDEWQHIAVTYDGNKLKLYYNGKQVGEADKPAARLGNGDKIAMFYRAENNKDRFTGMADEIVFFNTALTPDEVAALAKPAK